jgi:hypothetical protein
VDHAVAFGFFRDAERELKINKGLFMVRSSQLHLIPFIQTFSCCTDEILGGIRVEPESLF